ncbi:hypothetical protein J3F83DRAFT_115273 [Trichoderma novae-zelandiae]
MPVYSALLLAAAGFAAADKLAAMNLGEANGRGITVAGMGSASFGVHSLSDGCGVGMTTCDVNCMPLTGICCGLGNGAYCDIGYSCLDDGCCPVGKVCNGPPTGCEGDRDLCGEFCVPKGTCDGSGGGGGGGGGGGSGECPSGYEACDEECMPTGSVCCHNGYHCNAGQTCTSDFKCRLGGSGGGGGGGGSGGDEPTTSIDDGFTSRGSGGSSGRPTTYSLSPDPEPTATATESNPFGGDDVTSTEDSQPTPTEDSQPTPTEDNQPTPTEDSQPTPTKPSTTAASPTSNGGGGSGSNGNGNGGSNGGNNGGSKSGDGSSGTINAPSLIVGLLAFVPFVL